MRFLFAVCSVLALTVPASAELSASSDALTSFVAAPSQTELESMFTAWMSQYDKVYNSHEEFRARFQQFKDNVAAIREHNLKGTASYTVGLNQFADLSAAEFKSKYFAAPCSQNKAATANKNGRLTSLRARSVPASIDWRTQGAVSPVQDMGSVDQPWPFAASGAIEGAWVTQGHHSLTEVSAEYLSACCNNPMNSVDAAFQCVISSGGACSTFTGDCNSCEKDVKISGFKDIKSGDENGLLQAVGSVGPVAVGIEADQFGFQFYTGGVFSSSCGTQIDHAVLVVGYGTEGGQDYWIVKNSWGTSWGEQGYIRLIRNVDECGIALSASYPTV